MTTFTAGPATAITNSCQGDVGMRSSRARPPMGSRVISGVRMPNALAAKAWPNSCRSTQRNSSRKKTTVVCARSIAPAGGPPTYAIQA